MAPAPDSVDVAIVGDGLVGRPLALALAARGWRVAIVDRAPLDRRLPDDPLDERCTALSAASLDWLRSHALWDDDAVAAEPIHTVRVSHRGHFGGTRLSADELGESALGATFENRRFVASLGARLQCDVDAGRIVACHGVGPVAVQERHDAIELSLAGTQADTGSDGVVEQRLRAALLIAADGAASRTRELLGIGARRVDYRQQAILANVAIDREHGGTAHERFTANGPLALLPRPGRRINVVLCAPPEIAGALHDSSDAFWLATLAEHMPRRFAQPVASGPRTSVSLARIEADEQARGRALLLGNAARLLHPVAGQGYNLALRDVAALVAQLGTRAVAAQGLDGAAVARELIVSRRSDQRRTVAATDLLARGFRGHFAPLAQARAAALVALDSVGPARRAFARRAMRGQ